MAVPGLLALAACAAPASRTVTVRNPPLTAEPGAVARAQERADGVPLTSRARASRRPSMSRAEIDAFLARPLVARLATVRADGSPQVTPMWFTWDDGVLRMTTRAAAAKVRHLERHPRATVVVDVMEAPFRNVVVTLEGRVEVVRRGVRPVARRIYAKYLGPEADAHPRVRRSLETSRVVLRLVPARIESFDTTR